MNWKRWILKYSFLLVAWIGGLITGMGMAEYGPWVLIFPLLLVISTMGYTLMETQEYYWDKEKRRESSTQ